MKILFLVHVLPYPPNDGMRSTSFQLIRHLSLKHEITLLCLAEAGEEKYKSELEKICRRVIVVPHVVPRSPIRRLWNIIFERDPFCVLQFCSRGYREKLEELLKSESYDAVHLLSVNVSGVVSSLKGVSTLFFPHDSVSMQFYRNLEFEKNFFHRFYMRSQWKKMKRYEREVIPQLSHTVVVSDVDRDWILKFCPEAKISVIPAGVDCDYFRPQGVDAEDPVPTVLFRGVMNFPPNRDAVLYFHRRIMLRVLEKIPDLRFLVVGKEPPPEILKLQDGTHTFIEGLVPDLRPYIAKATVNICPMQSGSGIKNKILEAWAMGKAVVATSVACEGVQFVHRKNILIADDPETFAQSVIELIQNPKLRSEIGANGRATAQEKYSWDSSVSKFEEIYCKIRNL